ncbi:MAG: hypothetical protein CVV27_08935 [Candidatus Melainabacteria bacterium HGW-Melainabacteria-1]|nr:MAG: hypothetical protein CVV27_08935 [Candidatus Melainabacteria bacterium HGW-Melainabacteria-1]
MPELPRLLIGPLYNPAVIGAYAQDPNIRLFMPESPFSEAWAYDLVYQAERIKHFNQLFEYLPSGWEPDLVIWWDPVYQALPPGIEACPFPTAMIPGDWNLAFGTVLQTARAVDGVFADARLGPILRQAGLPCVYEWPGFAYDAQAIYRETSGQPIYDICFIGNFNPAVHPMRNRYLAQLLSLQDRYRLLLRHGVWGDDYRHALNQSRIVFNYTICQVMNMRAYEAPACGALLFIEENNLEVRNIFTDRVSCVLYNEANLIPLLEYYLSHEDERAAIAEAGYQVVQNYSYERHFERLLKLVPSVLANRLATRPIQTQHPLRRRLYAMNQIAASNRSGSLSAVSSLDELRRELGQCLGQEQLWELNALLVILFPYVDEAQNLTPAYQVPMTELQQGFEAATRLDPSNPVLRYHHALCCEFLGDETQALWSYSHAIELMAQGQWHVLEAYRDFILPFNKSGRGTDQLAFEWERASYEAFEQNCSASPEYVKLLSSSIWQRIGRILTHQGRYDKAWIAYENAYANFPRALLLLEMCRLLKPLHQAEKTLPLFEQALALEPMMITHLSELLSPELLIRHADQIQAWSHHYLPLFSNLDKPLVLSSLVLAAQQQGPPIAWQALLPLSLSADLYQTLYLILKHFETAASLQALQPLRQPWGLRWALSEAAPELELSCGLYWSEKGLLLGDEPSADFHRVYDQPSDLALGICGPDHFPFLFPPQASSSLPLLEELLSERNKPILVVLEAWTVPQLRALLKAFETIWTAADQTQLLLWCPADCDFSLAQLELCLPEDMQAPIAWLDEALPLQAIGQLLAQASGVLAKPQGKGLFYSYWASRLGSSVCWPEAPDWLPETCQPMPICPDIKDALSGLRLGHFGASPVPEIWANPDQSRQAWLNGLWKLRLWTAFGQSRD